MNANGVPSSNAELVNEPVNEEYSWEVVGGEKTRTTKKEINTERKNLRQYVPRTRTRLPKNQQVVQKQSRATQQIKNKQQHQEHQ